MYKVERIEVGSIGVDKAEEILNKSKGITCYRLEKDYHDPKFADDIVTVYGKDKNAIRDWYRAHAEANDWSTDCINLTGRIIEVVGCNDCHCNICDKQSFKCCSKCIGFREYHEGSESDNGFCTDGCNKCNDSDIKGTSELDMLLKSNNKIEIHGFDEHYVNMCSIDSQTMIIEAYNKGEVDIMSIPTSDVTVYKISYNKNTFTIIIKDYKIYDAWRN